MVDPKLISKKEESVEILDFRNEEIRNLFSEMQPDQALQEIKNRNSEDNFNGYSRPFKLITIPHQEDLDFLIKGNNAKDSRWYIWEKLLSESNLNLELIVLLTGDLPDYKIARNKLYLPEFLTEKRIRLVWASSLNGIFWSPLSQNYPSALLHWNSQNVKEANFQALLKPLTILEVFDGIFKNSNPGEIYNPGLRQAAFGTGYEKESKDILYEATKHITGTGNLLTSDSTSFPDLPIGELYKGNLNPSIPVFKEGIFAEIDTIGNISLDMCRLFGSTNSIVSKDQIPSVAKRLEKSYQDYLETITSFIKKLKKTQKNLFSLVEEINAEDGFNEEEYVKIIEHNIDFYSSKPEISSKERPIIVSTSIFSDILEGIKKGHNIKEYKILLQQLIKEIRPTSSTGAKTNLEKIWSPLTKESGLLDQKSEVNNLESEVKKMFGNRVFKFIFNLPWTLMDRKNVFLVAVSGITLFLSAFWAISTFIAGEAGSPPVFGSSGFIWWDNFVTNLFRNTQWEDILLIVLVTTFGLVFSFFFISKYVIGNIERVGRKLEVQALPEILRDTKVFLWKTLINDWVLAEDRKELIKYLESISNVLDNVHDLLVDKFLDIEITDDTIFQNRHLEPNPVLEINLNSVSENGIYKDFEGSVSILKSDLISLLERSFDQEWMKIRGAIGREMVPERINENFKKNLHEFEKRILNNSILEPKTALTTHGLDEREHIVKNLWSEGDYPREKVLDLLEPADTNELVHFLHSDEVSLLNAKSDSIIYTRFAPIVLDLPGYSNFIRTKESKVAGVMRLVPMSIQIEYLRILETNPLERVV
ncbi:hypothetical protein OAJ22_00415 [Acidimicrobiaceae bacterium]|nr:hypothetical protein [Acidimicrobiaceae bacterium]